jgi:methyltransferase
MNEARLIVLIVAVQRLAELTYASRNERALRARGGIEFGRSHYPLVVLLHSAWIVAMLVGAQRDPRIHPGLLGLFAILQLLRVWTVKSLGPFWTTRVITVPGEPLVRKGPYRFVRHPNYLIVAGEIALLPLAFGQVWNAVVFSILNLLILAWRIKVENAALAQRAGLPSRSPLPEGSRLPQRTPSR